MGNRRKGDVWKYFRKVSENAHGKAKVSCTFCGCTYLENATRMSTHLLKCSGYLKLHNIFGPEDDLPSSTAFLSVDNNPSFSRSDDVLRQTFPPTTLSPGVDRLNGIQDDEIRENIARAVYSCGLPPAMVEDPRWVNVFKTLNPNFTPPGVRELETSLLEKEFFSVKSQVDVKIYNSSHFGIKCKSSRYDNLNYLYVTTPTPYFLKTVVKPIEDNLQHDCEALADSLIAEFGSEKIISIVTDSYSGILNGAKFIEKKFPHVAVYQCIYEATTILCDTLLALPMFANLWKKMEDFKLLLKGITEEKVPYALQNYAWIFKKCDRFIFDYLIRIKPIAKEFLTSELISEKSSVNQIYLSEEEFWGPIEEIDKLLQPVLSSISKYKEVPPPLNHVVPLFNSLQTHFEMCLSHGRWDQSQQSSLLEVLTQCQKSVLHPVHLAANFFDPLAKGTTLSLEQQMQATELAYKLAVLFKSVNDEDCLVDMANYKANEGLWGTEYIWKAVHKLHPISWWNGFCSSTNLSKVAVRLFHLPSTADGGEGENFSSYNCKEEFLHGLSPSQRDMLTYVSINLKLIEDIQEKEPAKSSDNLQEMLTSSVSDKPMALCVPKQENDTYDTEGYDSMKCS